MCPTDMQWVASLMIKDSGKHETILESEKCKNNHLCKANFGSFERRLTPFLEELSDRLQFQNGYLEDMSLANIFGSSNYPTVCDDLPAQK